MFPIVAIRLLALAIVGAGAIHQWGWLPGFAVLAAVYLLMPEQRIAS